jgi:predicted histone-like DNA-binding protein
MITLKVRGLKNFKLDKKQYFPQVAPTTPIGLNDVASQIEKQSTVSLADIKGVLDALQEVVLEAMADGYSVRLGDLGSFRLTCTTTHGEDDPKLVTAKQVKKLRVRFTPSGAMQQKLGTADARTRSVTFSKIATPEA